MTSSGLKYVLDLMDKSFGMGMRKAREDTRGLDAQVNKTNDSIKSLGRGIVAALSVAALVSFTSEVTNTTAKLEGMENSIRFASGVEGQKNLSFLNGTIKTLNLDMQASYKGFSTLTGALMGTALEGQGVRDIFKAVSTAASVMGLTGEQAEGAFLALSQMASKGKVSAEELRQQLGERLPGALRIAQKAMGMTGPVFNKMLEEGKIYAEDFLPKFAKELQNTFQGGLGAATNSMQSSINKQNNALLTFKKTLGETFGTELKKGMAFIGDLMKSLSDALPYLLPVKDAFLSVLSALSPLWDGIMAIFAAFGTLKSASSTLTETLNIAAVIVEVFASGVGQLLEWVAPLLPWIAAITVAQWAWNLAMAANPLGATIMVIVALIGIIKVAYDKIGAFRGAVKAAWEAIKGFATAIKDYVITRFKELLSGVAGIGKAIMLFFKGDWKGAWEAGKEAAKDLVGVDSKKALINDLRKVGKNAGEAYNKGVAEAEQNVLKGKEPKGIKANDKLLGNGDATLDKTKKAPAAFSTSVPSGGGRTEKHTVFNIGSFVKELKIVTSGMGTDPAEIKKQMQNIFNEIIADLELRADA
ncbi:tape measure protein [Flavobacterium cerinum]|uniref:Tape measure protein N-terminal domain-containing protein n=1 Tax=Flavobacterium cerinum TaxID=2502784 RepID=A0A444HEN5_9FLAO|nr:tape measure protein [Flavobacterium cerinum]RWX03374.1 hypothetical protein EPI11_00145 [Flavobacterium cerinum]